MATVSFAIVQWDAAAKGDIAEDIFRAYSGRISGVLWILGLENKVEGKFLLKLSAMGACYK